MGAMFFSSDVNEIALHPLEKMIEKVNKIASNPSSVNEIKLIKLAENVNKQKETALISNSIVKIGKLLILGFGEAGSEIIAKNMAQGNNKIISIIIKRR